MSLITQSIVINAPVGKVFDFVVDPGNWTRYVTSLVDVRNMSADTPAEGSTFVWEYKMMGMKFTGKGTVTDNVRNKSFGLSLQGKFPIKETYGFVDRGDGSTEFSISIEYEVPGDLLGVIADKLLVEKLNVLEAKNVLEKIKTLCEGGGA